LPALVAGVHLAGGLAYLGEYGHAEPTLVRAQRLLSSRDILREGYLGEDGLTLVRALAMAWSQCPPEHALRGLAQLAGYLTLVSDSYSTNSHFCRSVISFMEALVLGYARSDLALGELGRRWLDEDEYLVRRRIHRDIGDLS
ncbi:MAG: hypothetical protein AAGC55_29810, partial [Myxococcota bacterium]